MAYFIKFNGISSQNLFKIRKAPTRVMANKKIELFDINTMDGNIYKDYGTYEAFDLELECVMIGNFSIENIQKVKEMFMEREGKLEFSDEEGIYYKARLNNIIPFDETSLVSGEFPLSFSVFPKAYLTVGDEEVTVNNNDILTNLGNVESEPLIIVNGAVGNFKIKVVKEITAQESIEQEINFQELTGESFIIDCHLEDCYSENKTNFNKYMTLNSDFIKLYKGDNKIMLEPTGMTVKIIPRWARL